MIQAFLHWWVEQLSGLIPPGWRGLDQAGRNGIVLTLDDATVTAAQRKRGKLEAVGRFATDRRGLDALVEEVRRIRGRRVAVALGLPASDALRKLLPLPLVARKNLRQVLELEMEHETPFGADEIVWDYAISRQDRALGRMDVELLLIPRERIARLQDIAAEAGLAVDAVEISGDAGGARRIALSGAATARAMGMRNAAVALGCAALLLAVTAAALPFLRLEWALIDARSDVAELREKVVAATALRTAIEQLSRPMTFFSRARARVPDPLVVMAAATNALPDDSYLTEFSLHGERVTLVGLSPSAANLIGVLSAARPLQDATFGAPVVRPDGNKLELFTIKANLGNANPAPADGR